VAELTIVLATSRANASSIPKGAANAYKVDTESIVQKVRT